MLALTGAHLSADNSCNPCPTTCASTCNTDCNTDCNKTHMTPRSHGVNLALEYGDGWRDLISRDAKDSFGANFQLAFFYEASTKGERAGRYFSPCVEKDCNTPCVTSTRPACDTSCDGFSWGTSLNAEIGNGYSDLTTANQTYQNTVTQDLNLRSFIQLPFEQILQEAAIAIPLANNILFSSTPAQQFANATQGLKMERQTYGFVLNYHQDLSMLFKGLYVKVNLPIAHVENKIKCCLDVQDWSISGLNNALVPAPTTFKVAGADIKTMIQNFLNGDTVTVPLNKWSKDNAATVNQAVAMADVVLQDPLGGCTIPCACETTCETTCASTSCGTTSRRNHRSKTGVADIDVQFGYNFLNKESYHHTIALGVTIPTGSGPGTKRVWEAQVGYNSHWGLGFSANGDIRIWGEKDQNLVLFHALNYRYLFSDKECRCLGLCGQSWGHLQLLGQLGKATLIPAANVLTTKVDVTLGSQVDYIIGLNYVNGGFSVDFGYNLFYRDAEDIDIKNCACPLFTPNTYALPKYNYVGVEIKDTTGTVRVAANSTAGAVGATGFQQGDRRGDDGTGVGGKWLSAADVDKSVAETPRQLSHKIWGGVGYSMKSWDIPFLVGAGAHYEFGDKNSTLSTWGVNVKVAVAF